MSSYIDNAQNPRTGKMEMAAFIDDFFGHHEYGVKFQDGGIYPIEQVKNIGHKPDIDIIEEILTWDDFFPEKALDNTEKVLAERGKRYGEFPQHARITQELKAVMKNTHNWETKLDPDQREALEMVAHKIGRILNGDPDYDDSWIDIAGYATLVAERLQQQ